MGLTRNQRIGNTTEELFDHLEELDDPTWMSEIAFDIAQLAYRDAYTTGDDTDAAAFTETVAAPIIRTAHTPHEEPIPDLEPWRNRLAHIDGENHGFHISPKSSRMQELYETVNRYDPDRFDHVIGIYSGGMAPAYVAATHFDTDPIILRYSPYREQDSEVHITETMQDRADLDGARVLVVDDMVETGETFRAVGRYLQEEGVADAYGVAAYAKTNHWPLTDHCEPFDLYTCP